jgi:HK97 family phage portal protein
MYLDIAGFSAWEIEADKAGSPLRMWPMRPDYCGFLRGDGRPLRAVNYAPPGLPSQDIPLENVLLFQYFDPLNPRLKGYSPTMACLRDIGVDNGMSRFLDSFIREGARFSGLLSTDQMLDDVEAERIRQRWKLQHSGIDNWNDIAVLGHGTKYQNVSMNFQEMAFPELDARTEARICMAFQMPPMILGAKVGLAASTYSNYGQARKGWYEEWVTPQWEFLAEQYGTQMIRDYDEGGFPIYSEQYYCEFMTKRVAAMQADRDNSFKRAINAASANVFSRDQSLAEMGMDPVDGKHVYVGRGTSAVPSSEGSIDPEAASGISEDDNIDTVPTEPLKPDEGGTYAEQEYEKKQFKVFAKKRAKEGKSDEIFSFDWKYTPAAKRAEIIAEFFKGL